MNFDKKINNGFLDLFYTFKLENKDDFDKINKILKSMNCVVSNITNKSVGFDSSYEEYLQFCIKEINKRKIDNLNKVNNELNEIELKVKQEFELDFSREYETNLLDDEIAITITSDDNNINLIKSNFKTYEHVFLEEKMSELIRYLNENLNSLNIEIEDFLKTYVLQPIKVENSSKKIIEKYINIYIWVYSSGCLTIQYTIPINDSSFGNWTQPEQNPFTLKTKLPKYIEEDKKIEEYIFSDVEHNYNDSIAKYNNYLITKIKKKINLEKHSSNLQLFTLIDYENIPNNFDSIGAKDSAIRDFFWIVHSPFTYLNETSKAKYNEFLENKYELSKYVSIFAGTQSKIIVAWNKATRELPEEVQSLISDKKYSIGMSGVIIPIHDLLMKTIYCNSILNNQFDNSTSKKDIIYRQEEIIYIKDYAFSLKRYSYESTNNMCNYLQNTLSNFLPKDALNERVKLYKEIVELKEAKESDNNNFILSFSAIIVALLLGVDAIDKLTTLIKNTFGIDWTNYNFSIWACLIIFLIILFALLKYKHKLRCLFKAIKSKFIKLIKLIMNLFEC
ncbi:TPA: hypothetical protein ACF2C8_000149 [Clostridium perfringens]|uniref:hypothetical protein n=1 Tax=Clostridium perfringens TaxID=1502 RepID=UPI003667B311